MYHYQAGRASKNKYDPSLKFRLPNKEEWERAEWVETEAESR